MSSKPNKNAKKPKKASKGEIIAYVVLGCMVLAIFVIVIVVCATTGSSGGGGGSTTLPPCCQ